MESIRIYVPDKRAEESGVREAMAAGFQNGATLYHATSTWNNGWETAAEPVTVVEVLDCDKARWAL